MVSAFQRVVHLALLAQNWQTSRKTEKQINRARETGPYTAENNRSFQQSA
jgi:hypothetical protein